MTLDELNTVFDFAVSRSIQTNREDLPPWAHRRAGIRAVVTAIRDNMVSELEREELNEILASDGVKSEGSE